MSPPDQELNPEPPADHFAKPKFTPAVNEESVTKDFIAACAACILVVGAPPKFLIHVPLVSKT